MFVHTRGGSRISSKGGGAHLKKLHRAEGGANIFGVFRVKNHDFTPKNHIFLNFRGGVIIYNVCICTNQFVIFKISFIDW